MYSFRIFQVVKLNQWNFYIFVKSRTSREEWREIRSAVWHKVDFRTLASSSNITSDRIHGLSDRSFVPVLWVFFEFRKAFQFKNFWYEAILSSSFKASQLCAAYRKFVKNRVLSIQGLEKESSRFLKNIKMSYIETPQMNKTKTIRSLQFISFDLDIWHYFNCTAEEWLYPRFPQKSPWQPKNGNRNFLYSGWCGSIKMFIRQLKFPPCTYGSALR